MKNFIAIYIGQYKIDMGKPAQNNIDFYSINQRERCVALYALGFHFE